MFGKLAAAAALLITPVAQAQSGIDKAVPPSPAPSGFIHDGGPLLSPAELGALNSRISALKASGRGDIGVAIVRDLHDYQPYEVGLAIYRGWKIGSIDSMGSARRDLGALILIVPRELAANGKGQCWITTGLGAEGLITDAKAGTICRESIIPHLRELKHADGIAAGIEAIATEFSEIEASGSRPSGVVAAEYGERPGSPVGLIGGVLGLLAVGGGSLVGFKRYKRRRPRLCPNGHGAMRRLDEKEDDAALATGQQKEESLKSVDYDVWACGLCDERLILRYKRWFTSYSKCPGCQFWTVKSRTRTLVRATTSSGGLAETTRTCQQCQWTETREHSTPKISTSSSGSSSSRGSSSGGSSFGGSGRSGGGGGGSSY